MLFRSGTSVWADDVTDLTNKKNAAESQLSQTQSELAYLLVQMDELEVKMHDKNEEIDQANADLAVAEQNMQNQYDDMKLRIKYMYEDQSTSIAEAFNLLAGVLGHLLAGEVVHTRRDVLIGLAPARLVQVEIGRASCRERV